jgi:hypothetical protein
MKALACCFAAVTLLAGVRAEARQASSSVPSLTGAWKFTAAISPTDGPNSDYSCLSSGCTLTLQQRDKRVTGTLAIGQGKPFTFTGKWDKGKLEFAVLFPNRDYRYAGTLQPDRSLAGSLVLLSIAGLRPPGPAPPYPSAPLGLETPAFSRPIGKWSATRVTPSAAAPSSSTR